MKKQISPANATALTQIKRHYHPTSGPPFSEYGITCYLQISVYLKSQQILREEIIK